MVTVSLCMIVRNEEAHMQACLQAAAPYANEIIVVDTGSTDRTAELAKQAGAKVYPYRWSGHFGEARNFALRRASGEWVLVLDADERLHPMPMEQFQALLQDRSASGYYASLLQHRSDQQGDWETDSVCRLFRNRPDVSFRGRIHEDITFSLRLRFPGSSIKASALTISHYGYTEAAIREKDKLRRNRQLLEQAIREEDDRLYYRYAAGVEDFMQERYAEAVQAFAPLPRLLAPSAGYGADLAYKLAYSYWRTEARAQAREAAQTGLARYPAHEELRELYGLLLLEAGEPEAALHAFGMLPQAHEGQPEALARRAYWAGQAHVMLLNRTEAMERLQMALGHLEQAPSLPSPYGSMALSRWLDLAAASMPAAEVLAAVQEQPFRLEQDQAAVLIGQYAMKWGIGQEENAVFCPGSSGSQFSNNGSSLTGLGCHIHRSDLLTALEQASPDGTKPGSPLQRRAAFCRAVLLAQAACRGESEELLTKLLKDAPERHAILYLWALRNQEPQESLHLQILWQYGDIYPELSAVALRLAQATEAHAPGTLPAEAPAARSSAGQLSQASPAASPADAQLTPVWEQAAYALLLMRGWAGFAPVWEQLLDCRRESGADAAFLPVDWRPPVYRAPSSVRKLILNTCAASVSPQTPLGHRLFTALLAESLGDQDTCRTQLTILSEEYPLRLEPRAALYAVTAGKKDFLPLLFLPD